MINSQFKLTAPYAIERFCESLDFEKGKVLVRPQMMSICKADMRYYFGLRDAKVLKQRLPMTLIHEACGTVLSDPTGEFKRGEKVILLPNIPGAETNAAENYRLDSRFRSSRADGFMQETLNMPTSQIVRYSDIETESASMVEFISVGVHAVKSFMKQIKYKPEHIGVWGDGALGYVICSLLKHYLPDTNVYIIGVNRTKLSLFQFVEERWTVDEVPNQVMLDATFECVGGAATASAIAQMIDTIQPEGIMMLLGVSEELVPINTRMVLEKGITMLGRSRSGREDFENAVEVMEKDTKLAKQMKMLVSDVMKIENIGNIHEAFQKSKIADYKMVLDWKI